MKKRMKNWLDIYKEQIRHNTFRTLSDCYERPSIRKERAWYDITVILKERLRRVNIDMLYPSVLTYNCEFFTAGYLKVNRQVAGVAFFIVETATHTYKHFLSECDKKEIYMYSRGTINLD